MCRCVSVCLIARDAFEEIGMALLKRCSKSFRKDGCFQF